MRLRRNRATERIAVNAVRAFFEANGCVFQEVDLGNDYGKDAYVDIAVDDVVSGTCVALQIKGGDKYTRADGFAIPLDENHFQMWRDSSVPLAGIVHDPVSGKIYWESITEVLAGRSSRPTSIPIPRSNVLTAWSLQTEFKSKFQNQFLRGAADYLLNLTSEAIEEQLQAIIDCFGLGRSDSRALIALRYFLRALKGNALKTAIYILAHVTPHPDIIWSEDNWIPPSICNSVRKRFRWSIDEIIHLLRAARWCYWQRANLGEDVFLLLKEDPDIKRKLLSVLGQAAERRNEHIAFTSLYLCLYWHKGDKLALYHRLSDRYPFINELPLVAEVIESLSESGTVTLF